MEIYTAVHFLFIVSMQSYIILSFQNIFYSIFVYPVILLVKSGLCTVVTIIVIQFNWHRITQFVKTAISFIFHTCSFSMSFILSMIPLVYLQVDAITSPFVEISKLVPDRLVLGKCILERVVLINFTFGISLHIYNVHDNI